MAKLSDIQKAFGTDKDAEENGIWKTYPGTEIKVRIRRSTQPVFKKALRREYRRYKQLGDAMPPEIELKIKMTAAAATLVTDWNIDDLPCTETNVLKQFEDMHDFYYWVEAEADTFENYRLQDVAEDAVPLSSSSTGNSNGVNLNESISSNAAQEEVSQSKLTGDDQN